MTSSELLEMVAFMSRGIMGRLIDWFATSLVIFCVAVCGCSKTKSEGIYPVRGSVIVNGEPAEYANVLFVPKDPDGQKASATVDELGEFRLTTMREFDGAAPGEYEVTISWAKPKNPDDREPDYGPELLPKNYQDPRKSGITFEVQAGDNTLDPIEITVK
jgi:hypothetical protein